MVDEKNIIITGGSSGLGFARQEINCKYKIQV